jgi:hypothetical protein
MDDEVTIHSDTWHDDTPKTRLSKACHKNSSSINGPMVLSRNKGSIIMAFSLGRVGLIDIVYEATTSPDILATEAAVATLAAAPKSNKMEGDSTMRARIGTTSRRTLTSAQRAQAGAIVDNTLGLKKCYCQILEYEHNR